MTINETKVHLRFHAFVSAISESTAVRLYLIRSGAEPRCHRLSRSIVRFVEDLSRSKILPRNDRFHRRPILVTTFVQPSFLSWVWGSNFFFSSLDTILPVAHFLFFVIAQQLRHRELPSNRSSFFRSSLDYDCRDPQYYVHFRRVENRTQRCRLH